MMTYGAYMGSKSLDVCDNHIENYVENVLLICYLDECISVLLCFVDQFVDHCFMSMFISLYAVILLAASVMNK